MLCLEHIQTTPPRCIALELFVAIFSVSRLYTSLTDTELI